ncbi:MAG: ASCH domain-containing protein [bacterium]
MKCLSLLQPYAWAVAVGLKTLETRTWATSYRGPLLIAASKRLHKPHYDYLKSIGIQMPKPADFEYGKIIATARLDECVRFTQALVPQALCPLYDGYGFWLSEVRMLNEPVPVKGALGLYEVPWLPPGQVTAS